MFPEWTIQNEDQLRFDKLVHILEKHEGREPKNDIGFLKSEVLSKWTSLSHAMCSLHQGYHSAIHEPFEDADLNELGKVVGYKFVERG
jgi:hypothetical protein